MPEGKTLGNRVQTFGFPEPQVQGWMQGNCKGVKVAPERRKAREKPRAALETVHT